MTHSDIYTKFMIEYDKANVTSSYPSLTEYEIATVLDKAYNALIAQKITGNNVRRSGLETDIKSVSDLEKLMITKDLNIKKSENNLNVYYAELNGLDPKFLYFVNASINTYRSITLPTESGIKDDNRKDAEPISGERTKAPEAPFVPNPEQDENKQIKEITRILPIKLISHETANKFLYTAYNRPWIKIPVCYIEDKKIYVIVDGYESTKQEMNDKGNLVANEYMKGSKLSLTYIKQPNTFVKTLNQDSDSRTFFKGTGPEYQFECNDTVAEELISLAITFALENVESPRLNTKLNMRGLES